MFLIKQGFKYDNCALKIYRTDYALLGTSGILNTFNLCFHKFALVNFMQHVSRVVICWRFYCNILIVRSE